MIFGENCYDHKDVKLIPHKKLQTKIRFRFVTIEPA